MNEPALIRIPALDAIIPKPWTFEDLARKVRANLPDAARTRA